MYRALAMIMGGCCSTVVVFELLIRQDSRAGSIFMFSQFLFVCLQSLYKNRLGGDKQSSRGAKKHQNSAGGFLPPRQLSIITHLGLTVLFYLSSLTANVAPKYGVSMPVTIIFRSSSLAANLIIGACVFRKRYELRKIFASLLVIGGVALTAFADIWVKEEALASLSSPKDSKSCPTCQDVREPPIRVVPSPSPFASETASNDSSIFSWASASSMLVQYLPFISSLEMIASEELVEIFGILLLCTGLACGAFLGHWQDSLFHNARQKWVDSSAYAGGTRSEDNEEKKIGNDQPKKSSRDLLSDEMLVYSHLMSLPLFFFTERSTFSQIIETVGTNSRLANVSLATYLALGAIGQSFCVSGVYQLLSQTSSLTLTITLSLRKITSLLISVVVFGNIFTMYHSLGAVLVFTGALLYSVAPSALLATLRLSTESGEAVETLEKTKKNK